MQKVLGPVSAGFRFSAHPPDNSGFSTSISALAAATEYSEL
jgi:hypothetical protein